MTDEDHGLEPAQYEALQARLLMMIRLAQIEFKASPATILIALSDVFVAMSEAAIGQERLVTIAAKAMTQRKPSHRSKRR